MLVIRTDVVFRKGNFITFLAVSFCYSARQSYPLFVVNHHLLTLGRRKTLCFYIEFVKKKRLVQREKAAISHGSR
jgi:hypothetical protein